MSFIVRHKAYGEGTVKSIKDGYIEIDFGDAIKKYQFPKAFGPFLVTDDPELNKKIEQAKREDEIKNARIEAVVEKNVPSAEIKPKKTTTRFSRPFNRSVNSPLLGERAQSIAVRSESEMFELVGYIASPGRVGSFEAEVPCDGRDETFERMFPGQTYRPIEMGETPSGMPNKLSPQFRINFIKLDNCPTLLKNNMGKGNGACVGRINKSRFVLELVQRYGFRFGDTQDVAAIRRIAENRGFLKDFEKGYKR